MLWQQIQIRNFKKHQIPLLYCERKKIRPAKIKEKIFSVRLKSFSNVKGKKKSTPDVNFMCHASIHKDMLGAFKSVKTYAFKYFL